MMNESGAGGGSLQGGNGINGGGATINGVGGAPNRPGEFMDGMHSGENIGAGTHMASSIQQFAPTQFHPGSILALPNELKTGNGMAMSTFQSAQPYDSSMRDMVLRNAAGGNGVMNV